ncbi:MAG: ABC transporter ATP-binding protein/permease [Candidatus Bathyarchaeota archaeon]|nr:ABC transporter ATP-binding protein/permease [Candidatus Bathyarchaeota archaeon]
MGTFARICRYISRSWPLFLVSITCMIVGKNVSVQIPLLTRYAIDDVITPLAQGLDVELGRDMLSILILKIVGFTAIVGLFSFIRRYASTYFSQKVVYDIRNDVFVSLQDQSFAFYDKTHTGQLLAKVTTDMDRIRRFIGFQLAFLMTSVILLVVAVYTMFSINTMLTLFLLPIMPCIFAVFYLFGKKIRPVFTELREQYGSLTSVLHEAITGIRVVRAFAQEDFEREKFTSKNDKYFGTVLASAKIRAFYIPLVGFLLGLGTITIFWFGGSEVIEGTLTIGDLVAFNAYLAMLAMPMRFFGMFISGFHRTMASGDRIFEVMDAERQINEKTDALTLPKLIGHVKFKNVSFSYEKSRPILKNITFDVKPGETVALLGATGSGKSTIIRLIPRFYDVSSGKITVDNYDVRDVKLKSLRNQMGIVAQEAFLFSMTIKENIAYGKPEAKNEEIVAAAKGARAHEFISALPRGYDSRLGERGVTLSGGQRQRVAIARALLMNSRILILDDSTSSVDVETEYEIQQALHALLKNRTAFVITQRVSTIRNADKIVVLEKGEIAEAGTHETLMAKKGVYYKIYQTLYETQKPIVETASERPSSRQGETKQ